jgi:hypothetical protein
VVDRVGSPLQKQEDAERERDEVNHHRWLKR